MLGFVTRELDALLRGGRVEKVQQPEKDEINLLIRSQGQNHRLLLCASANHARLHITKLPARTNPVQAPLFCMVLRKHLTGARIAAIEQPTADRVVKLVFETSDDFGDAALRTLIIEVMGKHSNLILVEGDGSPGQKILDSIKRVTLDMSRYREVLPGLRYIAPPAQEKLDPYHATPEGAEAVFAASAQSLPKALQARVSGISMATAREIACRVHAENPDTALDALEDASRRAAAECLLDFFQALPDFGPPVLYMDADGHKALDVFGFPYSHLPEALQRAQPGPSEALDRFFATRDAGERWAQKSAALRKTLQTHIERCEKKRANQLEALETCQRMDELRIQGDLLMSNLYRLQRGDRVARVENFYAENEEVEIPLDVQLTPSENAQRYYKKYAKAKATQSATLEQLEKNDALLRWLEEQLDNLSRCSQENELAEIRQELAQAGIVRPEKSKGGKQKIPASKPLRYRSSDGLPIYVGKNNHQNERIMAMANGADWWLHAKDMPGSHVVVLLEGTPYQGGELPDTTLREAALLAAYYSRGKESSNVPVDYVQRKFLKKPAGSAPGYVTFTHNRTLYITPDAAAVQALQTEV